MVFGQIARIDRREEDRIEQHDLTREEGKIARLHREHERLVHGARHVSPVASDVGASGRIRAERGERRCEWAIDYARRGRHRA